ncbi:MAG: sensor histidine kinase [Actinomycetales bacterium]|nr:sensor histidine kinase [Actinomycetales bacterium]
MSRAWTRAGGPQGSAGSGAPGQADRAAFWRRTVRGWDVAFYLMLALTAAGVVVTRPTTVSLTVALAALAALAVAYQLAGHRAAMSGSMRLAASYLAVLFVVVPVVASASVAGSVLLFIAYSQIWFFAPNRRTGILLVVGMTLVAFTAIGYQAQVRTAEDFASLATQGGVTILFAVLLGLWVTQVAEQSEERAQLLDRLEEAQAELVEIHHAAGVTAERERMAREIHDTLAQGFTSIIMVSQAVQADLARGRLDAARERLDLVERTARDNLAEARALVSAFAPVGLAETGLDAALQRLADRFGEETGLVVVVRLDASGATLSRDREVILLRAAQEALTNVRRHAQASKVELSLTDAADGSVQLEVTDNGRGIEPEAAEGFGLRGMRDRVRSGGGELAVSSGTDRGTRVQVRLPATEEQG